MSEGYYINLGCGGNILPAPWHNHEIDTVDIERPLPFSDESVKMILIEHCLEHVNSASGMKFLMEARRILQPGGVIRILVPELARLEPRAVRDICWNHGHQQIYNEALLREFLRGAGFAPHNVALTGRKDIDGHWREIGREKDDLETLRMEATK